MTGGPCKNLSVDFEMIPKGWWLYRLENNHTPIIYRGDRHIECSKEGHGRPAWTALLQRTEGGMLTEGRGDTPGEALKAALIAVAKRGIE